MYWFIAVCKPRQDYSLEDGIIKRGLFFKCMTDCYDHMFITGGVPVCLRSSHFNKNGFEISKFRCRFSNNDRKVKSTTSSTIPASVIKKKDIVFACPS